MGKPTKIFLLVIVIVLYITSLNLISMIDFSTVEEELNSPDGFIPVSSAAMGDKVSVTTFHDGFFWNTKTIYYEDYKVSKAEIFGIVPLPLNIHKVDLWILHFIISILITGSFIGIIFSNERRYYE